MTASNREVVALLDELTARQITLPAAAIHGRALLASLDNNLITRRPVIDNLLDLTERRLADHVERLTFLGEHEDAIKNAAYAVGTILTGEIAAVIRADLDSILDQLRPPFDAAAAVVFRATQLGIGAQYGAEDVIALGNDQAIKAWRGLAEPMATLADVAAMRLRIADVADTDPLPDPYTGERPYAACLTSAGSQYTRPGEGG